MILPPLPILLSYVFLSAVVALWGRKRMVGFGGMFVLSLFFSPVIVGLVLLVTAPSGKSLAGRMRASKKVTK